MAIARYLGTRIALGVLTLLIISMVTFWATNVVPTDPARLALGKAATPEQLKIFREQQGLDRPVAERYVNWLGGIARGDWGTSALNHLSVRDQVGPRVIRTLIIGILAMAIAVPIAFALGVYTAQRSGRKGDLALSVGALFVNAMPEFVIGIVLLVVFAVELHVFPVEASGVAYSLSFSDKMRAYALPIITLAVVLVPYILRMVRANVRDVLSKPYVRGAALRGLGRRKVIWRHVVPNASLPVVNVVALSMAELIGGVVVVETVLGFPGIGQLFVTSVLAKDIPMVQAIAIIIGLGYVVINFAADAALLILNPRLRAT